MNQPYINITHAVPPKFDLNSLPTSPPATPNLALTGDDYFSQSVFAHAAVVPSYHGQGSGINSSIPTSPNPVVPPSSVQVSILERYIPPVSTHEYNDFFSVHGHSVLVDRLSELSDHGGTLMLMYPTKTGAESFTSHYLGPVLDPILLRIVNLNSLYYDLAGDIGRLTAVPSLKGFDAMKNKVQALCRSINSRASTGSGPRSTFQLIHSSKGACVLDQVTWRDWFVQQEQQRIKDVLNSYWQRAQRLPMDKDVTAMTIARQIIDGVRVMPTRQGLGEGEGIEIGLFIIRRTTRAQ